MQKMFEVPIGYTISEPAAPSGKRLKVAGPAESQLASRVDELWKCGGLTELEDLLDAELKAFIESGATLCHQVAFEFAYGLKIVMGKRHASLGDWRWCVGGTVRGTHSWIEHRGEAFDVGISIDSAGRPEQMVFVRPVAQLRHEYKAFATQSRSFLDFIDWLDVSKRIKLFPKYPVISNLISETKKDIWATGRMGLPAR